MITGYFLVNSRFNFKKIIILLSQVWSYSVSIYAVTLMVGTSTFSVKSCITALFPTVFAQNWFFTAYIIIYALSPFINKLLIVLSKKDFLIMLTTILLFWCIIPTLTMQKLYGDVIPQFFMFYSLGAYLRLHPGTVMASNSSKLRLILIGVCSILILLSIATFIGLGKILRVNLFFRGAAHFLKRNSLLVVILSVSLVAFFLNLKIPTSKMVNTIASCTFGIYLIHDNKSMRHFIWIDIFDNSTYAESKLLFFHLIICSLAVFVVCMVIEYIRKVSIERLFERFLDRHWEKIKIRILKLQMKFTANLANTYDFKKST